MIISIFESLKLGSRNFQASKPLLLRYTGRIWFPQSQMVWRKRMKIHYNEEMGVESVDGN
jgi:ABC-type microcin C transport system permease subunit YejE